LFIFNSSNHKIRIQNTLLLLAAIFVFLNAIVLTIAPAVRARSWNVNFRWDHWLGVILWCISFGAANNFIKRGRVIIDPFLLPIFALLSGWGMLTVWRLMPNLGFRQSIWILLTVSILIVGLKIPSDLNFLRRYKYLWLISSLLLTAITLFFGTNPLGYGPRMWLGCCGIYLQPSEPLKLLLITYLAAYLADSRPALILALPQSKNSLLWLLRKLIPLLAPTFLMISIALALLLVQRDLGTASILLLIYIVLLYLSTGKRNFLVFGVFALVLAGVMAYALFDIVQIRVDSWLFPWEDPSGRSYQVVQSLMAIANGGLLGRGLGVGNPGLVPISHSDFIYTTISEEYGLVGAIALLLLIGLLSFRGLRIVFYAKNSYQRYLAAGLIAYISAQSILIIGGNIRLLPLTGVTLPFVSYGGSSLLVSALAILLLMHISSSQKEGGSKLFDSEPYLGMGLIIILGLAALALLTGWWSVVRGPALLSRTDNARRSISDRNIYRGTIFDRKNAPINTSFGEAGNYVREYLFPSLSNVVGYTSPIFGQAGLEASLDDQLRGLQGNPSSIVWWNHLLYGQPPAGLDVRLTIDLDRQFKLDALLKNYTAALVMIDSSSGEILAMASYPGFDANQLSEKWEIYTQDEMSPLLNRAVVGKYPLGEIEQWLSSYVLSGAELDAMVNLRMPGITQQQGEEDVVYLSPLQAALLSAAINHSGISPAPIIAAAVNTYQAGWIPLKPLGDSHEIFSEDISEFQNKHTISREPRFWELVCAIENPYGNNVVWYWGGGSSSVGTTPISFVLLVEEENIELVSKVGRQILMENLEP